MAVRQRAIQAEDKQERRDAILDAAEGVLLNAPDRVASVAEVAVHAGLAKGTVYLYFPSKEELLLAVHERRIDCFFRDLIALVEAGPRVDFDAVYALTRAHLVDPPLVLPLAARCFGLMTHSIPPAAALAFKQRMAARLERAGAGVERHFPLSAATPSLGRGAVLLRRSYALILGLWQMSAAAGGAAAGTDPELPPVFAWGYPVELEDALRALWAGMIGAASTAGSTAGVSP
ncbi:TetR family transcriptional regulator [Lamprocystis purpurea]|jgi:AcrR family transcriptional regulator|uniref:TetR family transcriptional regulator n=1 Tax=Lamprocystis purpurea TaxID=61598 RepID=UPI000370EB49|nr:TetR family transcriptional regulator [Lamprocystis purpurea]